MTRPVFHVCSVCSKKLAPSCVLFTLRHCCLPFRMCMLSRKEMDSKAIQTTISDHMLKVFTQVRKPGSSKLTCMLLD